MKRTDTIYEKRKKLRLCIKCFEPLLPEETKIHCDKCRLILKSNYQSKKEECEKLRICFLCGKSLTNSEYFKCHKCYEKSRIIQIPYNDKIDRKSKEPKLCKGGCDVLVDVFGKYCPTCKIESKIRNTKNSQERAKQKKRQNSKDIIKKIKPTPKPKTNEKEISKISTKNFYLQLEIDRAIKMGNYMGFNIKRIRELRGTSVPNFTERANLKPNELQSIEKRRKKINLPQFKEIIKALGVDSSMFKIKSDKLCKKLYSKFNTEIVNIDFIIKGEYRNGNK